jgi:hypothetical protein
MSWYSGDAPLAEYNAVVEARDRALATIAALEKRIAELEARPVASAGLIEAAEWRIISEALRIAREDGSIDNFATDAEYEALKEKVRTRAADRSGK